MFNESFRAPYIIAEVNSSHNGSIEIAKKMIDAAKDADCDCVKFQSWTAETLYCSDYYRANPISKRIIEKFSFSESELLECAAYCQEKGIAFSSTPYSEREVDFLVDKCKVPFVKISSMEINNPKYLEYVASKRIPIVLSTGMADLEEIHEAVKIISYHNKQLCLLHCISQYPTDAKDVNLRNISLLLNEFPDCAIGFSDHTIGFEIACAAVAREAVVIEKHLTLDRSRVGMDNQMAMEPIEIKHLVKTCRTIYSALGEYDRIVSPIEIVQRGKMRRSLVYARDIAEGTVLSFNDLNAKRPGNGVPPTDYELFVGKTLIKDVNADTLLHENDFRNVTEDD